MAEGMVDNPHPIEVVGPADLPKVSPWRGPWQRARSSRPSTAARYALVIGAVAALVWLANTAWQSLLPFLVGGFIAYAVLPFVNRLDRIMPRWMASLLVVLGVFLFIFVFFATLVPLLLRQVLILIGALPSFEQMQEGAARLNQSLTSLPEPLRVAISRMLNELGVSFRAQIDNFILTLPQFTVQAIRNLINTFSAVLGLLILPTWLLIVVRDSRQAVREINKLVPSAARVDFWSIVRIVDRSLRAFLNRQVTQAILVGAAMAGTALVLDRMGVVDVKYPFAIAMIIGVFELIPEIGPIIVYLLLLLAGLSAGPTVALIYLVAYFLVHRFVGQFVEARVSTQVKEPHAAVMALLAIMLSQVGFVYALLSVPIIVLSRDIFRYVYGRLSDPPRPAGLLPDDPRPIAAPEQQVLITTRTPLVYQRAARARPTTRSGAS